MALSLGIFLFAIILIMVRPRPLNEATAALLGAFLMVVTGVVSPSQVFLVLKDNTNILLFFLGLMVISAVADHAGFFQWGAARAVRWAGGNGRRLLLIVFFLGTVLTAFFSNDSTALILTPIVLALVTSLKLNPLPYVFACAFIANSASMILPVSNPVNLLAIDRFDITLGEYLKYLLIPAVLAVVINIALFTLIFRKLVSKSFAPEFEARITVDSFFYFACVGLGLTAIGYLVASVFGWPLSAIALGGAAFLLIGGFSLRRLDFRTVRGGISWSIFFFIIGLALLVKGLENEGVMRFLGEKLVQLSSPGSPLAVVVTTFGNAIGSNLINNWSAMMVSVSSLGSVSGVTISAHRSLLFSAVAGADLGPNITILGSLSSMLWLTILRKKGLNIHPLQYLRLGLIVTPPILAVSALMIYVSSRLWG